jgi:hypothetical protein
MEPVIFELTDVPSAMAVKILPLATELVTLELTDVPIAIGKGMRPMAVVLHARRRARWRRRLRGSRHRQQQEKETDLNLHDLKVYGSSVSSASSSRSNRFEFIRNFGFHRWKWGTVTGLRGSNFFQQVLEHYICSHA